MLVKISINWSTSPVTVERTALIVAGLAGQWWRMHLIPALGRQRQVDLSEFEASLVYRVSSRRARAVTQRNPVSKNKKSKTTTT